MYISKNTKAKLNQNGEKTQTQKQKETIDPNGLITWRVVFATDFKTRLLYYDMYTCILEKEMATHSCILA